MALKTNAEMLEEVQTAISAVLLGQSYSINGRSVTKANLRELREMSNFYKAEMDRDTRTSTPVQYASFNFSEI